LLINTNALTTAPNCYLLKACKNYMFAEIMKNYINISRYGAQKKTLGSAIQLKLTVKII